MSSAKSRVVVLGGGIGGLTAAYFLLKTGKFEVTVLEQAPFTGGLCSSFEHEGFTLDHGPHKMYSVIPGVLPQLREIMEGRLLVLPKRHRIHLRGGLLDYPLRLANVGKVLGLPTLLRLGLGYAAAFLRGIGDRSAERSYADYVVRRFGRPVYDLIFEPLADKVWGDPEGLHPDMARARIPASGGLDVLLRILRLKAESAETNAEYFYYPERGFGDFPATVHAKVIALGGKVFTNARSIVLERDDGGPVTAVRSRVGEGEIRLDCDLLVSSIPLPALGSLVFGSSDPMFEEAAKAMQFRHLVLVYLFVKKPLVLKDQWIFFPERKFTFSRLFEQKQLNPALGPADRTALCCDLTCSEDSWHWNASDEELVARCRHDLVDAGYIDEVDVYGSLVKRYRNFYPRYDHGYVERLQLISDRLRGVGNVLTTGRIGMYNYNNSDHCTDMGRFIADGLARGDSPAAVWSALEDRVKTYRIVD